MDKIYKRHCNDVVNARHHVKQEHLVGDTQSLFSLDMKTIQPKDGDFNITFQYKNSDESVGNNEKVKFNCIAAWFHCDMTGDGTISLTNSPSSPDTHWGRTVFPLGEAITCHEGDTFEIVCWNRETVVI